MNNLLTPKLEREFEDRGISRRNFGRIAAMISTGAAAMPYLSEPALAQLSAINGKIPDDAVMINSNENPLGPCKEALEAVHKIAANGGRYMYGETDKVQKLLAEQEGVKLDYVRIYPGSSAPLHQAVLDQHGARSEARFAVEQVVGLDCDHRSNSASAMRKELPWRSSTARAASGGRPRNDNTASFTRPPAASIRPS